MERHRTLTVRFAMPGHCGEGTQASSPPRRCSTEAEEKIVRLYSFGRCRLVYCLARCSSYQSNAYAQHCVDRQ